MADEVKVASVGMRWLSVLHFAVRQGCGITHAEPQSPVISAPRVTTNLLYGISDISLTVLDSGLSRIGLDRFGRVRDLNYMHGTQTRRRDQYGYNVGAGSGGCGCQATTPSGNRVYDLVTQRNHDNDRSWMYGYDGLHRLISADHGALDSENGQIIPTALNPVPRQTAWHLDNLGNWTSAPEAHGRQVTWDFNGDGAPDSFWEDHVVNAANEIVQRNYGSMDPADPVAYFHDPAGNLAFDEQYVYQCDAWNRLIQVNLLGIEPLHAEDAYRVVSADQLSDLVCRYTYDGVGRLIIKETPVQTGPTYLQRKDFYYDGVRRIQETIYRPDLITGGGSGGPGGVGNDESPVAIADDDEQQIIQPPAAAHYYWTDREYVYGPDYVDEFVCQIPYGWNHPLYMLQDANYNMAGLVSDAGAVLEQYTYEPYGGVIVCESFAPHAVNRRMRDPHVRWCRRLGSKGPRLPDFRIPHSAFHGAGCRPQPNCDTAVSAVPAPARRRYHRFFACREDSDR